ncbi:MAG: DUF3971 domain-containing protein [Gammaproteobacteria bacterium]
MQLVKSCLRWSYRVFWYSLAATIITLAIAISLVRIFLPDVKAYRGKIEYIASTFLGQEVHIKSMDARLSGLTPTIIFRGVRMLSDNGQHEIMRFSEARLGLNLWQSFKEQKAIPESFTVYGVKLGVTRRKDNTLVLQGLNIARFEKQINSNKAAVDTESSELASWLFRRSLLSLKHSTIIWHDALRGNKTMRFNDVNIDLRNDGDRHQFTGTVSLPRPMGNSLAIAFDFSGNILNPKQWQGRFYISGRQLQIQNWGIKPAIFHSRLEDGLLGIDMWGQWHEGKITALTANVRADKFQLSLPGNDKPLSVKSLSGLFHWQHQDNGWRLNVDNLQYATAAHVWPRTRMQVQYADQDGHADVTAYSSYLRLSDSVELLQKLNLLDKPVRQRLKKLAPRGELTNLHVRYQSRKGLSPKLLLTTRFKGLAVKAYRAFPGVADLDGELWTDQQHGELRVADSDLQLNLPRLFRKSFAITQLEGTVNWWHSNDAWHVSAPQLAFASKDVQSQVAMNLSIPDNKASPYLDLQAHFTNGDASQTSRYLPVGIMDNELIQWLDHGIVGGHIKQGDALFHGRLNNFPFTHKPGTFVVDFQAGQATLDYRKGWPSIKTSGMQARFTGRGMMINANSGMLYRTHLQNIKVSIDNFRLPVLKITGSYSGPAQDAVRFLVQSPVAPGASRFYRQSTITGDLNGRLSLSIPLSKQATRVSPADYRGYIQLKHAGLQAWNKRVIVNNINGRLNYSAAGVSSNNLVGHFSGQPTRFTIYTREHKSHHIVNVGMMGTLDIAKLHDNLPFADADRLIVGKSKWEGLLRFGSDDPDHPEQVSLHIESPLKGMALNLPAPLNKPASTTEDLQLDMRFNRSDLIPLEIKLGQRLNAALLLQAPEQQPLGIEKGTIAFSSRQAVLPDHKQLIIRGRVNDFPVNKWLALRKQYLTGNNLPGLKSLGLPLSLDMDYLNLHNRSDTPSLPAEDPRQTPLFDGDIRDLIYNDMQLGHVIFNTEREANGIRLKRISLDAPFFKVSGSGSWFVRQGKQHTNILMTLESDNVGEMISHLGYKGVIQKGKGRAVVQLNWPDSPNHFSPVKLNGTLGAVINDGVMSDVEPGAGRLVGLLSLSQLPRHLALDFSEFRKGLNFKQIQAQFNIVNGDAITKNLHIVSPIALINITGRTGLARRDYDLHVSVAPNVSKTLPVISWLAWGGQVGALTFLMDQLFGKQFNKSIASTYQITGTWEHPDVKQISQTKSKDNAQ